MKDSVILKYFKEISAIPRASFDEKAISDYLVAFAKERGLAYIQDDMFNVIIFKDAAKGQENLPSVMLQSHIDMVAEKNKDTIHDFSKDPLDLYVEEGYLKARGTTLGADDGAGVAYMLAVLDNQELKHPRLECVFTVQEETGLTGAMNLDGNVLKAKLCIGLDGAGENTTCVSSSGGARATLKHELTSTKVNTPGLHLAVRGLLGGHSGIEIDQERGSATKILGIILKKAFKEFPDILLSTIEGGLKMNAITREGDVTFTLKDIEGFKTWFKTCEKELINEYKFSDSGLNFELKDTTLETVLTKKDTLDIINILFMLPYGVIQKSKAIENLVITSANIGTVDIIGSAIEITIALRATQKFVIETVMEQVEWLAAKCGFSVEYSSIYPGWDFDANSPFRKHIKKVYKELRNDEMIEEATHGGLELGVWKDKLPEIDIASFGPIMFDIHTPEERLNLESFERTYEYLEKVLETINEMYD